MPTKLIITEIFTWLIFAILALGLALPLTLVEHHLNLNDVLIDEAARPVKGAKILKIRALKKTAAKKPLALPLVSASASPEVGALGPSSDLLVQLSAQNHSRPVFNASSCDYEKMIAQTARQHQVSPLLVKAVIQAESNFNPKAVSNRGAVGLMQVMPSTARAMGVADPMDPQKNIQAGVRYLKELLKQFNDDEKLAIAAYNCGPEAMKRWGNKVPPYGETKAFVDRVMNYYQYHLES